MIDEKKHILSLCNSEPACLVNSENQYYNSDTISWGCPPMKNRFDEMYDSESNFWANGDQMDAIWNFQDATLAEHALGFQPGSMEGQSFYRFNDINPDDHNYRIASGHEPGVNEFFTGIDSNGNIDLNIYNGKTSGYIDEGVSDKVPISEIYVEGPYEFISPENEFGVLKNQAEEIEDNYFAYEQNVDMSILNNRIDMLTDRIDAEKNYLDKRANEIETTVKDGIYDDNILEKNRGMTESNWCRDYSNQLENIKEEILHIQNYINNLAKNIQTDFNEINTDYNRTEEVDNMSIRSLEFQTGNDQKENSSAGIPNTSGINKDTEKQESSSKNMPNCSLEATENQSSGSSKGMPNGSENSVSNEQQPSSSQVQSGGMEM